jgi:hypothetical protein
MQNREFVVTCVNVQRFREITGVTEPIYELLGLPEDLQRLAEAVTAASRTRWLESSQRLEANKRSAPSEAHDQQHSRRPFRVSSAKSRKRKR